MIYKKRRIVNTEAKKTTLEHDSTSQESIREKSRVGQLTRRRAISGSEREIKGAWEVKKIGRERGEKEGCYEKHADTLLRICQLATNAYSPVILLVELYLFNFITYAKRENFINTLDFI